MPSRSTACKILYRVPGTPIDISTRFERNSVSKPSLLHRAHGTPPARYKQFPVLIVRCDFVPVSGSALSTKL